MTRHAALTIGVGFLVWLVFMTALLGGVKEMATFAVLMTALLVAGGIMFATLAGLLYFLNRVSGGW